MKRREFLVGTAAGAAAFVGLNRAGLSQAPQAPQGAPPAQGRPGGAGRGQTPAIVPAGMMGDRADVIFASPEEISGLIAERC